MKALFAASVAVLFAFAASAADAKPAKKPPAATRIDAVTDTYHGVTVSDPYRWLESGDDAAVKAWSNAQTAKARAYLDGLPYRAALQDYLMKMISATSPSYSGLKAAGGKLFAVYFDPSKQQPMLAVLGADADPAKRAHRAGSQCDGCDRRDRDRLVSALAGRHEGRGVAVEERQRGWRFACVRCRDRQTDRRRDPARAIPNRRRRRGLGRARQIAVVHALSWRRQPEADRHFFQTVWRHTLGTALTSDTQMAIPGLPRVAEIQLRYAPAAHALLISVANGDGGEFAHYVQTQDGAIHQVTKFADGVDYASFGPDGALYLVSEKGAPRRQILKLARGRYDLASAKVIVAQGDGRDRGGFFRRRSDRVRRQAHGGALSRGRAVAAQGLRSQWRRRARCGFAACVRFR